MPSSISGSLASELLSQAFVSDSNSPTYSPLATIYIGLFTTVPTSYFDGGGEVEDASISRVAITNNLTNFPLASTSGLVTQKVNGSSLSFGTAGSALSFLGFGFYDSDAFGTWLGGGSFAVPLDFASGANVSIAAGSIAIVIHTASVGGCSGFLCRRLLDMAFGAVAYAKPGLFGAYFTTAPNYITGIGGIEPVVGGYTRVESAAKGSVSTGSEQSVASLPFDSPIIFANPTANQGTVVAGGIFDAASGGNLLCGGNFAVTKNLDVGSSGVLFPANSIQVRLLSVA